MNRFMVFERRPLLLSLALALSLIVSALGLGFSYRHWAENTWRSGAIRGVHQDGWISHQAEMKFSGLQSLGNRLRVRFSSWRPAVKPHAVVKVSVCGEPRGDFLVQSGSEIAVSLRGTCEPRLVTFDVPDPFVPSGKDNRELGAQIARLGVYSPLYLPIVDLERTLCVGLCLFVLSLLAFLPFAGRRAAALVPIAIPLAALPLVSYAQFFDPRQPYWLWLFTTLCAAGLCLGAALRADKQPSSFAAPLQTKESRLWLALAVLVVIAGGAIRANGIEFGLPNNYHPDEVPKVNALESMRARGTLDPNYFLHPSLLLYATYFMATLLQWLGVDMDFRTGAFFAGRMVSALAGTGSIFLLFLIGRRLYSSATGAVAAALLAFFPLHVTCSRYLKEDALLGFFILLSLAWMLKAVKEDKPRLLYLAAAAAGLSASTKYSGFLTAGVLAAAPFLRSRSWLPDRALLRYVVGPLMLVPLTFVAASPYIVLNYPKFISDFRFEKRHMLRGHTQAIDAWSQYWMYHFSRSVAPGMTLISALAAVVGMGVLAWRRRIEDLFILAAILAFYLPAEWVKAKPAPQPERYIFPCLPFLALGAAELCRTLWDARARAWGALLALAVCAAPLWRSYSLARDIRDDTRRQAARWMVKHLSRGAPIFLDWERYAPYFSKEQFDVEYIEREGVREKEFTVAELKQSGRKYMVLSSLFFDRYFTDPNGDPVAKNRFRNIFKRVPIVREFTAPSGTYGFHNPRLTLFSLEPQEFARLETELKAQEEGRLERTSNELRTEFRRQ